MRCSLEDKNLKLKELYKNITSNLNKDPLSKEIEEIAEEIVSVAKNNYEIFKIDTGEDNWFYMVRMYLVFPEWINLVDKKYGKEASEFIGKALEKCSGTKLRKIEKLYKSLTSNLSKSPCSKDVQDIICEIAKETNKKIRLLM